MCIEIVENDEEQTTKVKQRVSDAYANEARETKSVRGVRREMRYEKY